MNFYLIKILNTKEFMFLKINLMIFLCYSEITQNHYKLQFYCCFIFFSFLLMTYNKNKTVFEELRVCEER